MFQGGGRGKGWRRWKFLSWVREHKEVNSEKRAKLTLLRSESVRVRAERLAGARRHEFISRRRPSNASSRSVLTVSKGGSRRSGRGEGSKGGS